MQLQVGLLAQLLEGVLGDAVRDRVGGRRAERGERARSRRRARLATWRRWIPATPREVVDVLPVLVAERPELADAAVVDRVGLGRRRVGDEVLEPPADAPVVGAELLGPEGLLGQVAEQDVDARGREALDRRDPLAVEAELEDVGGLRVPRELRVERLVAPRAEVGGRVDAEEEVGDAAPAVADERRLVDDLDAGAHRLLGLARAALPVDGLAGEIDDLPALVPQPLEVGLLVLVALAEDQLGLVVLERRRDELAARDLERKGREVLAGEVGRHVGRRQRERSVAELHRVKYQRRRRLALHAAGSR